MEGRDRRCFDRFAGSVPLVGFLLLAACVARAADDGALSTTALADLSLEDLLNVRVTSVSKKEEKLNDAAAAIFVLSNDDLRRSGATTVADALRLVPGLQVAQIDANKWAITARGFNGRFSNKLLVMVDGRSVYTPLFGGVYWDSLDLMLEDIERIEVIRGPGGAMWGANAVNGVINIITKSAKDTQGGLITAGTGTQDPAAGGGRYGGKLGKLTHYRVYAKGFERDHSVLESGDDAYDQWDLASSGFRIDWDAKGDDALTLQGSLYERRADETVNTVSVTPPHYSAVDSDSEYFGGNLLGRWTHRISDTSDTALQIYYDHYQNKGIGLDEFYDTVDIDFQHRFSPLERNDIVWGLGHRFIHGAVNDIPALTLDPDSRNDNLISAFVQDDIAVIEDRLKLTLGSKFEHNDYTGFEVMPSIRLLWTPHKRHSVWTAVSRVVRTPSDAERCAHIAVQEIPSGVISSDPRSVIVALVGNPDMKPEELTAYELGYRIHPRDEIFIDVATFYNDYKSLRTVEPGALRTNDALPYIVFPQIADNKMKGETYGVELAANWQAQKGWNLRLGYTYLRMRLHTEDSGDTTSAGGAGESPHNQVQLRSSMQLARNVDCDVAVRYVDSLPSMGVASYVTCDLRLAWRPSKNWEIALVGQNLLHKNHLEYIGDILATPATPIERSASVKATYKF